MTATESITALGSSSWTCRSVIGSVTLMCILLEWPDSLYNSLYISLCLLFWHVPLINVCKTCLGLVIKAIKGFFLFKDALGLFPNLSGHQIPCGRITVFPKYPSWDHYRSAAITNKSKHDLFGRESFQYQEKPGPMKTPSINHRPPPSAPFVSLCMFPTEAIILQDVNTTSQAQKRRGDWDILIFSLTHPTSAFFFSSCALN